MTMPQPVVPSYFEPVEDGLLISKGHDWSIEKHHFVRRYIEMFTKSMKDKPWRNRRYIDLFSECGKLRSKESGKIFLGSPLLALTTEHPFTDCIFVEIDKDKAAALDTRCQAHTTPPNYGIYVGDSNKVVHEIVREIQALDRRNQFGRWSSLNLAFLDPYGLELHWSTVEALASVVKMDLIIYYSHSSISRNLDTYLISGTDTNADHFFGGREWRDIARQTIEQGRQRYLHRTLMDYYKSKLADLGYVDLNESPEPTIKMGKGQGPPLYRLIFASKHKLGAKFWREANKVSLYG